MVAPGWLEALARAAVKSDLVGGRLDVEALNGSLSVAWRGGPIPTMTELPRSHGFLPYVAGGNCGIWSDVARDVAWDESFDFGASDIEFAWRAQMAGYRATFEPSAVIDLRYRTTMAALAKQYFRYGASEPHLFRCFRDAGMRRRTVAEVVRSWGWLIARMPRALRSREMLGNWLWHGAVSCGRVRGSLRWRVFYI